MGLAANALSTLYFVDSVKIKGKQNVYCSNLYKKKCTYPCLEENTFLHSSHYSDYLVSLSPTSSLCCFGSVDYN